MDLDRQQIDTLVLVVAVATLPLGILTMILFEFPLGVAVFVVGWFLVVPILGVIGDQYAEEAEADADDAPTEGDTAVETLRRRYAAGELSDEEFEAKLERLVATEEIPEDAIQPTTAVESGDPATTGSDQVHESWSGDDGRDGRARER